MKISGSSFQQHFQKKIQAARQLFSLCETISLTVRLLIAQRAGNIADIFFFFYL
jgi:hypothetical protein